MAGERAIRQSLAAVGQTADDEIDVGRVALSLAALDRPRVALGRYLDHLDELAADTAAAGTLRTAAGQLDALRQAIHLRHGYRGDVLTYDDPQNANLMRVIDRRKGLPVALGILYLHAAHSQGWHLCGLNFPGHFLLRLEVGGERLVIDPFHDGRTLTAGDMRELLKRLSGDGAELHAEHYQPVGNRAVLLRLQNNVKTRALQERQPARAVAVLETMLLIAPSHAVHWRELGLLQAHLGNLQSALAAFDACLANAPDERMRREVAELQQQLRTRLN